MHVNADLHIHSPYSMAVSRFMQRRQLLAGCVTKGIQVPGTGDALHPAWRTAGSRSWPTIPVSWWSRPAKWRTSGGCTT